MQNKNEGNENKIILGDLNWTLDEIDRDGENNHKDFKSDVPIIPGENSSWLEDLWRRENPDYPEFSRYDRSFAKDPG